jgi:putative transposase
MTYNDLRKGRASLLGQVYLVTTVTESRRPIFAALALGRYVVNAMRTQDLDGVTDTLAFVVMPDHVHWMFELTVGAPLGMLIKQFKGSTARRINLATGKSGAVWQPSFHDHAVRNDESLVAIARYVVMNPVRAGLATRVGDYSLWDAVWDMSEDANL